MDYAKHALQLVGRDLYAERKGYVVRYRIQIAAQITVLVDAAHQKLGDAHVAIREVAVTQLLGEILLHRTALGYVHGTLLVVFRKVVYAALVTRGVVVADIVVDRYLLRLLVVGCVLLLFEHDVLLDLLLHALFELHRGQLQQLYHLYLLRRESLLQFLNLTL